jgi:hypothetical protein
MNTSEEVSKKSYGGLTRNEVAIFLQPVIELHNIEMKDECFEFPSVYSSASASESELPDEVKTTAILYKDIASISPFEVRIEVLLQCGELFVFSTTDNIRTHLNTYSEGGNTKSGKPITAQDIAGNILDGLDKTLSQKR